MRQRIIRLINYYKRGRDYISLIQSVMIGVIFLEQFKINRIHYWWIIPTTVILLTMIGFFEKSFGFYKEDFNYRNSQNPTLLEIDKNVKKLLEEK